uniref:Phytoene/squalene synthase family protein n=2 Tax=Gongylonema pulchrum TaxID=637853 RepID=A0A183EJ85_9BILA
LARGIFLLPADATERYQLSAEDIYAKRKCDSLRALITEFADIAEKNLVESRSYRGCIDPNLHLALMASGATLDHLLLTLRKNGYDLWDSRLQRGFDLLAWRLWWRKLRGQY